MDEVIFIASDHAGFDLKEKIITSITNRNFVDLGTSGKESVDYPDYANKLISKINLNDTSKGILICGSGIGMAIAANRNNKIRAGLAFNSEIAKLMREHNDANVLVLPGKFINIKDAIKCVKSFLSSKFEGGRHKKRVNKLG